MNYEDLCILVGKVDPDAENYLRFDAKKLETFSSISGRDTLKRIFTWSDSPQGHDYWSLIDRKISS